MQSVFYEKYEQSESKPFGISSNGDIFFSNKRSSHIVINIKNWLSHTFLPNGYPDTVKKEYLDYQIYDSIQALCSYFRSVLCTSALLSGAGVGSATASALASAITWILRDGVGMIGSVTFASVFSSEFGSYVKEWRLFADIINDVALTLDMLSPLFPRWCYLPIISISAICKAMCGISAGASKLCITNHLCLANNAGDLAAKENTQETAVTLVGLVLGLLIAKYVSDSVLSSWILFVFFTTVHVYANYRAVLCLQFTNVNRPRFWLLTKAFFSSSYKSEDSQRQAPLSVSVINSHENILLTLQVVFFGPLLGSRPSVALSGIVGSKQSRATNWNRLHEAFRSESYMIVPLKPSRVGYLFWRPGGLAVLLLEGCPATDVLKAYFHALYLWFVLQQRGLSVITVDDVLNSKATIAQSWSDFARALAQEGWDCSEQAVLLRVDSWRYGVTGRDDDDILIEDSTVGKNKTN